MKKDLAKVKKFLSKFKKAITTTLAGIIITIQFVMPVCAAGTVQDSQLVKGIQKLLQDLTTWLMILAPVVSGLLIIYFCIRRSASDEMDQKKWNNRVVVAIVSCIGAVLASATLNLIIGYFA